MAVGLERFTVSLDEELAKVAAGGAVFKALRGEWGRGKTLAARWMAERARRAGFATSELQISETEPRCTTLRPCTGGSSSDCR